MLFSEKKLLNVFTVFIYFVAKPVIFFILEKILIQSHHLDSLPYMSTLQCGVEIPKLAFIWNHTTQHRPNKKWSNLVGSQLCGSMVRWFPLLELAQLKASLDIATLVCSINIPCMQTELPLTKIYIYIYISIYIHIDR